MRSLVKRIVSSERNADPKTAYGISAFPSGRQRVGWLGAIGLVTLGLLTLNPFLGQWLAQESYDLIFQTRPTQLQPVPEDLVVIRMDDDSRRNLGQRRESAWDRALHSRLIDALAAAGSRTVVIDLLLAEETSADDLLAQALQRHGKVVLSANLARRVIPGAGELEDREAPVPAIASHAAAIGLLNVVVGRDGVARRLFPGRSGGAGASWEPSLGWAAATLEGRNHAAQRNAPTANLWLNYYGPAQTLPALSYEDALKPESAPRLRDRIVVLGAHFEVDFPGTRKDTFPTPYGAGRQEMPGLELHATGLLNLIRGEWLQRLPAPAEAAFVAVFGILLGWGLPRLRPLPGLLVCLATAALLSAASLYTAWSLHLWWSWLVPVAIQLPAGLIWAWGAHLLLLGHEKEWFRRSLATYLPPRVVDDLVHRPESLRLGGTVRRVVILFTDITDFSRISQRTDPQRLVAWLNEYYDLAIGCVHAFDGTVLGILGDGLFAVWNAPAEQPKPECLALEAATALTQRLRVFEQRGDGPPVRTRIGLHSGEACVGNFGRADHFAYTAIGDAVNLASRLNGLNKHLGTEILVSDEFRKGLTHQAVRPMGRFRFKGFDQAVEVFEPCPPSPPDSATPEGPHLCDTAIRQLREGHIDLALETFRAALQLRPNDRVAEFYLQRIPNLPRGMETGAPMVIEMDSK